MKSRWAGWPFVGCVAECPKRLTHHQGQCNLDGLPKAYRSGDIHEEVCSWAFLLLVLTCANLKADMVRMFPETASKIFHQVAFLQVSLQSTRRQDTIFSPTCDLSSTALVAVNTIHRSKLA
jgi:hypothetical protein